MKLFRYIKYALRDTFRSLNRHKEMSFISVFMVFMTMLILGSVALTSLNGYFLSKELESNLEVSVFLKKDINVEQRKILEKKFESLPSFASYTFISKEEAYEKLEKKLAEKRPLADKNEVGNPLPDAYAIKFIDGEKIAEATSLLNEYPEIDSVNTSDNIVSNVLAFNKTLTYLIQGLLLMMILVVILLINGTIKLTVLSRKDEIEIMKYIGATNFYVKLPFFLEGILIGLVGSMLSAVALHYGYETMIGQLRSQIPFIPIYYDKELTFYLLSSLVGLGCLIGALGSTLAIKKHLKV